jgi:drug/metabolite transporter (DMT)-like permease
MLSYPLALLAACANAVSSVLQRRANRDLPQEDSLRPGLIRHLLGRPVWFAGVACMVASFVLQAGALASGELSVVQPLLLVELPITLLLSSRIFHAPLHRREWLTIGGMTLGLAAVLYFLAPSAGKQGEIHWQIWLAGAGANGVVVVAAVEYGRRSGGGPGDEQAAGRRAACYGIAAGCQFALTAALMKGAMSRSQHGVAEVFTGWELYAMAASGLLAVFLLQSAVHAGKLLAAQPGLTLSDPLLSVLWGVFAFGERVRGGIYLLPAAVGIALLAASVVVLTRSPLLKGEAALSERGDQARGVGAERGG